MRPLLMAVLLTMSAALAGQPTQDSVLVPSSEHGWHLSPHGNIRVLVIYAEMVYDKDPSRDPARNANMEHWPSGQLPKWKDDLFDPQPLPVPKAMVSRYYHDCSLGNYQVLGDYVDGLAIVKESEMTTDDYTSAAMQATKWVNSMGGFRTAHGLPIADFDLWKNNGKMGMPKEAGPDVPLSFDHVMVIFRNHHKLSHGLGSTDAGSSPPIFGHGSDTQSRFGALYGLPFEILKHEFNHLLLGGNNFHSGGGNAPGFQSYFICLQGGWSLMGAANSSLLSVSGWDRDRLGWKAADAPGTISALNTRNEHVRTDLDPMAGDTGLFVLRDFVTSGDVLRIKVPFLATDEFPQWIWLENHQGWKNNGSPTDRFHYEDIMPCVEDITPGLFAYMQVDRANKTGKDIFNGDADYLRAMPASGAHDIELRGDTVRYECLWPGNAQPYVVDNRWANPLTGHQDMEFPVFDHNHDGKLTRTEMTDPRIELRNGQYIDKAVLFGHARQAFTPTGNNRIGMGTNPPSANMLTLVSSNGKDKHKGGKPNNRVVHLNPISVEVKEQRTDGSMLVHVRNDDTYLANDVRWCADSIVLHNVSGYAGHALWLADGKRLLLDRSRTPTRLFPAEEFKGRTYFSASTRLVMEEGSKAYIGNTATLELVNGSELHIANDCLLDLHSAAKLKVDGSSRIVVHGTGRINGTTKQLKKLRKKKRIHVAM
ncbi:MAG: hypothetical protein IPJ76_06155 [Flavobacteriales bacterium]|nr:MAG: hypothetical protein IPJ76_06155 [Flavobacteriales bacterium]